MMKNLRRRLSFVRNKSLICLFLTLLLFIVVPIYKFAESGGRGGHYIGGSGSSHKGGHYYNPATGNRYQKRDGSFSTPSGSYPSRSSFSSHKYSSPIRYHNSVHRNLDGKIERSEYAKKMFLKRLGYNKVPLGYEVDHIIPLYAGGSDTPGNMQLLPIRQHKAKTKSDYQKYGR